MGNGNAIEIRGLSGYKDDILARHGLLKCKTAELERVEPQDCISTHRTEYGADMLVADRELCRRKYPGLLLVWGLLPVGSLVLFYVSYDLSCLWYRRRMRQ